MALVSDDVVARVAYNAKRLRRLRGCSQRDVGRILGVSFQQVQKYENGHNRIPVDKLYALACFYEVSPEVFFDDGCSGDSAARLKRVGNIAATLGGLKCANDQELIISFLERVLFKFDT